MMKMIAEHGGKHYTAKQYIISIVGRREISQSQARSNKIYKTPGLRETESGIVVKTTKR